MLYHSIPQVRTCTSRTMIYIKVSFQYLIITFLSSILVCVFLNFLLLCCSVLCSTALYFTLLCFTVLYCTVLCCSILYCAVLCCTVLYLTVLYCNVLCCTVLKCTVQHRSPQTKSWFSITSQLRAVKGNENLIFRHRPKYSTSSRTVPILM